MLQEGIKAAAAAAAALAFVEGELCMFDDAIREPMICRICHVSLAGGDRDQMQIRLATGWSLLLFAVGRKAGRRVARRSAERTRKCVNRIERQVVSLAVL